MNHGEVLGSRTDFRDADGRALSSPTRFYALDSVRATAMLLGVFYHLPLRSGLPDLARTWLWNLVFGVAGFAASQALADTYASQANTPNVEWIRLGSFALYGVGTAYSACGFLGFFQRFLDRPTRLGRYFADTALWIYLVHLPLIPYVIWWIEPWRTAWWASSLAGMVIVTGATLVLFELCVRPTPLVYVFGPPSPRRISADKPLGADGPAAS
jgi:hypothetical protein